MVISEKTIERVILELGNEQKAPFLERCVKAVASRWNQVDGLESEFETFCLKHYVADTARKGALSQNLFAARIPFFPMGLSSNDQFQMAAF